MRNNIFSFALLITLLASVGCQKEEALTIDEGCSLLDEVKSKEVAKVAIIGDWEWIQTEYPRRRGGTEATFETPQNTGKRKIYRFTEKRFMILENDILIYDLPYDIKFWGEGTNTVDSNLALRTYRTSTNFSSSFLSLDQGLFCMKLINSYDDAGSDVTLKKIIKGRAKSN
jgi:hypothetical protein